MSHYHQRIWQDWYYQALQICVGENREICGGIEKPLRRPEADEFRRGGGRVMHDVVYDLRIV